MSKKVNPLPEGTPEFKAWLKEQTTKDFKDIFSDNYQPADFNEVGVLSGNEDLFEKPDAELFPDEIEEYTPEERRQRFKVHTQNKTKDNKNIKWKILICPTQKTVRENKGSTLFQNI